jgi:hypothetical protein
VNARTRKDGRRQFVVYLRPHLIKKLKKAALDQDTPAYEITEEAVRRWLSERKTRRTAK